MNPEAILKDSYGERHCDRNRSRMYQEFSGGSYEVFCKAKFVIIQHALEHRYQMKFSHAFFYKYYLKRHCFLCVCFIDPCKNQYNS